LLAIPVSVAAVQRRLSKLKIITHRLRFASQERLFSVSALTTENSLKPGTKVRKLNF
jgi:hypothetical protein